MKGTTALIPAKNKIMNVYPFKGNNVSTVTTKKQGKGFVYEEPTAQAKEKSDPIVTFSRPPPFPPVLGPLVVLSLLENWLNRDGDDS